MKRGKQTCRILKEIRRQIAEANNIEFITSECRYQGDCLGTCPKCEAEVRYLEAQLAARRIMGKAVILAGISTSALSMAACSSTSSSNDNTPVSSNNANTCITNENNDDIIVTKGEVVVEYLNDYKPPFDPDKVQESADVMPQFPGGDPVLLKWIQDHIRYPQTALEDSLQCRVIVRCVVEKDGSIGEVVVVRSRREDLDNEAVRVTKSLPKFIPAQKNGETVATWYTLPINFKLPQAKTAKEFPQAEAAKASATTKNNAATENRIYGESTEQMAQFPGGDTMLLAYIEKNIRYPESALRDSLQGRVVIRFVVKKDGSIGEVVVARSKREDLDNEAVRVIKSLPNFTPGKLNGECVDIWYIVPVSFKLPAR